MPRPTSIHTHTHYTGQDSAFRRRALLHGLLVVNFGCPALSSSFPYTSLPMRQRPPRNALLFSRKLLPLCCLLVVFGVTQAQVFSPGVWVQDDKGKCLDGSPPGKCNMDGWMCVARGSGLECGAALVV
jgi:hypothetical protein